MCTRVDTYMTHENHENKPRLLDLFCGGGGCCKGYQDAGFYVVGVDIVDQPRYPGDEFVQADVMEWLPWAIATRYTDWFDVISASPPCQRYGEMQNIHKNPSSHPDLVEPVRNLLKRSGKPYVIENVIGSPLDSHVMLCGTMFGLRIIRHRLFESPFLPLILIPPCNHSDVYDPWHGPDRTADKFRDALGIDWLPVGGGDHKAGTIDNAIPPAYCEFIGRKLLEVIRQ